MVDIIYIYNTHGTFFLSPPQIEPRGSLKIKGALAHRYIPRAVRGDDGGGAELGEKKNCKKKSPKLVKV